MRFIGPPLIALFVIGHSLYAQGTLSVTINGDGAGKVLSVAANPAVNCGAGSSSCSANYANAWPGIRLVANPSNGSSFISWGGACSGSGQCVVNMNGNKNVTATFGTRPLLSVSLVGRGNVTSVPVGILCGVDCDENYDPGSTVTLVARGVPGASATAFVGWTGTACSGSTNNTCNVPMNGRQNVTATFAVPVLTVSVTGAGGAVSEGTRIDCAVAPALGSKCSAVYAPYARPVLGVGGGMAIFTGWGGACSGIATSCTVRMAGPVNVSASFRLPILTLAFVGEGTIDDTRTSPPAGSPTTSCGAPSMCEIPLPGRTSLSLRPIPAANFVFREFSHPSTVPNSTCRTSCLFTMPLEDVLIVAFFNHMGVNVTKAGSGDGTFRFVGVGPTGQDVQCGPGCMSRSVDYAAGAQAVIEHVTPDPAGVTFAGFSGAGCSGERCTFAVSNLHRITATFHRLRTLTVNVTGEGSVSGPNSFSCDRTNSPCLLSNQTQGSSLELTAHPGANTAPSWTGCTTVGARAANGDQACTVVITSDQSVRASFIPR